MTLLTASWHGSPLIGCFHFTKLDIYNPQCSDRWMNEEKQWFRDHTLKTVICIIACLMKYPRYIIFICYFYFYFIFVLLSSCFSGGSIPDHSRALQTVSPPSGLHCRWIPQLAVELHRGLLLPILTGKSFMLCWPAWAFYVTRLIWFNSLYLLYFMGSNYPPSICPPSEVSGVLLLPGVCHYLSDRGRLRLCGDSRDQKQDLYGDQPDVLKEGAHPGDAGSDERGPAAAEEDERLRWGRSHFAGVWQLFICGITEMVLLGSYSGKSEKFKS